MGNRHFKTWVKISAFSINFLKNSADRWRCFLCYQKQRHLLANYHMPSSLYQLPLFTISLSVHQNIACRGSTFIATRSKIKRCRRNVKICYFCLKLYKGLRKFWWIIHKNCLTRNAPFVPWYAPLDVLFPMLKVNTLYSTQYPIIIS